MLSGEETFDKIKRQLLEKRLPNMMLKDGKPCTDIVQSVYAKNCQGDGSRWYKIPSTGEPSSEPFYALTSTFGDCKAEDFKAVYPCGFEDAIFCSMKCPRLVNKALLLWSAQKSQDCVTYIIDSDGHVCKEDHTVSFVAVKFQHSGKTWNMQYLRVHSPAQKGRSDIKEMILACIKYLPKHAAILKYRRGDISTERIVDNFF